jgi:hypothetical protein
MAPRTTTPTSFDETFSALRGMLAAQAKNLLVTVDKPGDYQVASRTMHDRAGRPLFVAAIQIKKTYVSYHLMPVYAVPALAKTMSAALRKRMQGKACFNFTTIDRGQLKELSALTRAGIKAFRDIQLPWASPPGPVKRRKSASPSAAQP